MQISEVSRHLQHIAGEMKSLPTFAKLDAALAAQSVRIIQELLDACFLAFQDTADAFAQTRLSADLIRINGTSYVSAHAAAADQANRFLGWLGHNVDQGYRPKPVPSGRMFPSFDIRLIPDHWNQAKFAILSRLDDEWQADFADIPALIEQERSQLAIDAKQSVASRGGRPRDSKVAERRREVKKLAEQGMKPGEIAAELDMPADTIHADLYRIRNEKS